MNACINLNQERAKRLFLNMLEKAGSKTEISFNHLVMEKLVQDPFQLFEVIDVLWNCNESVPRWGCHIWSSVNNLKIGKFKALTYSELVQELKEDVNDAIYYGLTTLMPEYCKNESHYCWFCDRSNNYLDCRGNEYPNLINMDEEMEKMEPLLWVDIDTFGISIGNAERGTIVKCVCCKASWDINQNWCSYFNINDDLMSSENQKQAQIIQQWRENRETKWYSCPFSCHFY